MSLEKTEITPANTGREEQLQFLRFLAFFNVYITHAEAWIFFRYPTSYCAAAAVSFFFMLSGLVTGFTLCGREIQLGLREEGRYLWRKLKKVYPLYFFTTLYTFLYHDLSELTALANLSEFPKQLIRNLLLIQSWFPEGYFSYNGAAWFLSSLLFMWVITLPVLALLNRLARHPRGPVLLLGSLAAVLFCTAAYCYLTKSLDMDFWQYIFPPARMGEYISGMILGILICRWKPRLPKGRAIRILFTMLEAGAMCYWFYKLSHAGGSWRSRVYAWLVPDLILLTVFTLGAGWFSRLFRLRPLVRLGDISFECFLIHQVFLVQYTVYHPDPDNSLVGNAMVFLYCLLLSMLLAGLIHKFSASGKRRGSREPVSSPKS